MQRTRTYLLVSLLLACTVGCQSGPRMQGFSQKQRMDYAISAAEFETLTFYTSTKVMVRAVGDAPDFDSTGTGVLIAPKGTAGKVVAAGPDWLRVTFGLGEGAYFKTDTSKANDSFWLATEVEGTETLLMLKDPKAGKTLHIEGITYDVTAGSAAYLLVDLDIWEEFVATRTHVPGVQ
jgi:hypothetical protein